MTEPTPGDKAIDEKRDLEKGVAGKDVADVNDDDFDEKNIVDELPDDLNAAEFQGDYTLPNNNRRRIPAAMYCLLGIGAIGLSLAYRDSSPLVNTGTLVGGMMLTLFGVYGLVAGVTLRIDETDALTKATEVSEMVGGHASAQLVWRTTLSRPVWRVLLYSAENPPLQRALVLVDGIDGRVVEWFKENNPEQLEES